MLPKQHRLRRTREISRLYRSRHRARGDLFVLRYAVRGDNTPSRFAFVVSRRVSKKAVERNRLTRQARGCIARTLPQLRQGVDVLVIAEKSFSAYDRGAVCKELHRLLGVARLFLL